MVHRQQRALWILLGYGLARVNLQRWAGQCWQEAVAAEHKVQQRWLKRQFVATKCVYVAVGVSVVRPHPGVVAARFGFVHAP